MRLTLRLIPVVALVLLGREARAQSDESAAIIATARDYIDGFAQGDSTRMRRALHADLAKRLITGRGGSPQNQTADMLTTMTGARTTRGVATPGAQVPADSIKILDRYRDMAMVRIGAGGWVDYLHVGKFNGEWKIINVAWQTRQ